MLLHRPSPERGVGTEGGGRMKRREREIEKSGVRFDEHRHMQVAFTSEVSHMPNTHEQ